MYATTKQEIIDEFLDQQTKNIKNFATKSTTEEDDEGEMINDRSDNNNNHNGDKNFDFARALKDALKIDDATENLSAQIQIQQHLKIVKRRICLAISEPGATDVAGLQTIATKDPLTGDFIVGTATLHLRRPGASIKNKKITKPLHDWFFSNFLKPWPSRNEKQTLASMTGLTVSQVGNWFINQRGRVWKKLIRELSEELKANKL